MVSGNLFIGVGIVLIGRLPRLRKQGCAGKRKYSDTEYDSSFHPLALSWVHDCARLDGNFSIDTEADVNCQGRWLERYP